MRSWTRMSTSMSVLVLIGACANTCGTRDLPAGATSSTVATTATAKNASTAPMTEGRPGWKPAADSETTRRLRAAQAAIEADTTFGELSSPAKLSDPLRANLGEFVADGEAESTMQTDAAAALVVAARNYVRGSAGARVKITDTARLPSARHTLSSHLTLIGNEATGGEHGAFVHGSPALLAYFESQHTSRASALVGKRYLVQITVQDANEADSAQHLLEQLDWSSLAIEPD